MTNKKVVNSDKKTLKLNNMTIKNFFYNKRNIQKLFGVAVALSSVAVVAIISKNIKDKTNQIYSKSLSSIVSENKDNTCFDELIGEKNLNKIDELEKYIELSEILKEYRFYDNTSQEIKEKLLKPEEIYTMLLAYTNEESREYLSNDEFNDLSNNLAIQECLVNNYIRNSYRFMEMNTMMCVKAQILDTKNMNEDNIDQIKIPAYIGKGSMLSENEDRKIKINDCTINSGNKLCDLIYSVYEMQSEGEIFNSVKDSKGYEYNKTRNKIILDAIKNMKEVSSYKYELNNGVVKEKRKF